VALRNDEDFDADPERFDLLRSFYFPQDFTLNESLYLEWVDYSTGSSYFDLGYLRVIDNVDGQWDIDGLDGCFSGALLKSLTAIQPGLMSTRAAILQHRVVETTRRSLPVGSVQWPRSCPLELGQPDRQTRSCR
jgi:hypothetical protein